MIQMLMKMLAQQKKARKTNTTLRPKETKMRSHTTKRTITMATITMRRKTTQKRNLVAH